MRTLILIICLPALPLRPAAGTLMNVGHPLTLKSKRTLPQFNRCDHSHVGKISANLKQCEAPAIEKRVSPTSPGRTGNRCLRIAWNEDLCNESDFAVGGGSSFVPVGWNRRVPFRQTSRKLSSSFRPRSFTSLFSRNPHVRSDSFSHVPVEIFSEPNHALGKSSQFCQGDRGWFS